MQFEYFLVQYFILESTGSHQSSELKLIKIQILDAFLSPQAWPNYHDGRQITTTELFHVFITVSWWFLLTEVTNRSQKLWAYCLLLSLYLVIYWKFNSLSLIAYFAWETQHWQNLKFQVDNSQYCATFIARLWLQIVYLSLVSGKWT